MIDSDNVQVDYEYTRANLQELIEKGKDGLDLAMRIAEETEHPRAIEVLAGMLKNVSDVNDKLMDLNKKKQEAEEGTGKKVTNNNLFIGSTTELQRLLKKNKKEQEIIDVVPEEIDAKATS
tara:strand:- start:517 stop:879 length:363 start_codon:yes stop_codon:yes gene_type:complete